MPITRGGRGGLRGGLGVPLVPSEDSQRPIVKEQSSSSHSSKQVEDFQADLHDVLIVKDTLKRAGNLPDEIALMILDSAEYWACSSTTVDYTNLPQKHLLLRGTQNENQFLIRSEPLGMTLWSPDDQDAWHLQAIPKKHQEEVSRERLRAYTDKRLEAVLENPCRKIVYKITANDQGWGGNREDKGSFRGSWTWFDAGLERFEGNTESESNGKPMGSVPDISVSSLRPVWPAVTEDGPSSTRYSHGLHAQADHKIQCNRTADRTPQTHVVEWRYTDDIDPELSGGDELEAAGRGRATGNGEFVRNLKLGDVATIWGRARFGGWQNQIERVEIKVYWKAV